MNPNPENEPVRESAAYGQACIGCSRAKCKCVLRGRSNTCERCHRLKKDCQPSPVVRKRVSRRTGGGRTKNLEDKLDSLVTLLAKQAEGRGDGANGDETRRGCDVVSSPDSLRPLDDIPLRPGNSAAYAVPSITHSSYSSSSHPTPASTDSSSSPDLEPSPGQAEEFIRLFREQHLKFFPFIYISPDTRFEPLTYACH